MKSLITILLIATILTGEVSSNENTLLLKKVQELTENITDKETKCIRISQWISKNICNYGSCYDGTNKCKKVIDWFENRGGECGIRARLFVKMCQIAGIKANVFNLYNLGRVGGGHSASQAYYNKKWHYFDSTYAGYFKRDEDILSWDEIKSNPKYALEGMIIFDKTCDYSGAYNLSIDQRSKIDNTDRMTMTYTPNAIINADTGFYRKEIIWLTPEVNLSQLPIKIGILNDNFTDVTTDGILQNISEQLGVSLGTGTDMFHTAWKFSNAKVGERYELVYYVYKANAKNLNFIAEGKGLKILRNEEFITSPSLFKGKPDQWHIPFIITKEEASLNIGYKFIKQQKLLFIDKIEIHKVNNNKWRLQ